MFTLIDPMGKLSESKTNKEGGSRVHVEMIIYKSSIDVLKNILSGYGLENFKEIDRSHAGFFLINEFAERLDNPKGLLVINSIPSSVESDMLKRVIESLLSKQALGYNIDDSEAAFLEIVLNCKGFNSLLADVTTGKLLVGSYDIDVALHQCVGVTFVRTIHVKRGRGRPTTKIERV